MATNSGFAYNGMTMLVGEASRNGSLTAAATHTVLRSTFLGVQIVDARNV